MNLYVSNLLWYMTGEDLKKLFSVFGRVLSCNIIFDEATGASCGAGFVEMYSELEGYTAITELQGKNIGGNYITVTPAGKTYNHRYY